MSIIKIISGTLFIFEIPPRDLFNLSDEISNLSEGALSPNDANGFDFSAIGKGYAIDKIAELLEKNGVNN